MIRYFIVILCSLAGMLSGGNPAWNFLPGGNGREWKLPEKTECRWTENGLYLHGANSAGMEIELPGGLDASKYRFLNYTISSGEYSSQGWLYFAGEGEEFHPGRRIRIQLRGFDYPFENRVDCRTNKFWKGTIRKLRLTPIPRELDNVTIKKLYFSDGFGGMIVNGSFESSTADQPDLPVSWKLEGRGKLVNIAGQNRVLHLEKNSGISQEFQLTHEYPVELTLSHKLASGGKVRLEHFDIFDRKISSREYALPAGTVWRKFQVRHISPDRTAFIRLTLSGEGEFDTISARELVPASEQYRLWNHSHWIWDPKNWNSSGRKIGFRKTFRIDRLESVSSMKMQLATRKIGTLTGDHVRVYVNGRELPPAVPYEKWDWVRIYELRPLLRNGRNVVAVEVENRMDPGGLNVELLTESRTGPRFRRSGSDSSWKCGSAAGNNWYAPDYDDSKWNPARIRGQATPGSFCRLPYRFLGTAGTVTIRKADFPERISTAQKYEAAVSLDLKAEPGFEAVTDDTALYFHLINSRKDVKVKFHAARITAEMLKNGKAEIRFPFDPSFLRKDDYTLRIYADRLALAGPAGFTGNRTGNFIEKPVRVIDQRRPELADARITGHEKVPRIEVNGKGYSALRFNHGGHTQTTTEQSLAIAEKIHTDETRLMDLIGSIWEVLPDGRIDFSGYDTFLMSYLSRHPDTYFTLHWGLDTAGTRGAMRNWLLRNPSEFALDSKGSSQSGTYLTTNQVASMASIPWQNEVVRVTEEFVRHIKNSPYADRVIGLMPDCGISHEWLYWGSQSRAFMDYSLPFRNGFRDFLQAEYKTLENLNRQWNRNFTLWEQADVPSRQERMNRRYHDFLLPETNRPVMDLRKYLNTTVSGVILRLLNAVKRTSGGKMLAGVYYGYSLYFCGPYFAPFSGHHALGRLLDSPDLDFLISPCRYDDRGAGGASGSMIPIGSLRKHRKLYVTESDNRLLHAWDRNGRTDRLRSSRSIMEREFAFALATGSGMEWLDFGEGWVPDDRRLVNVFRNCQRVSREIMEADRVKPDYDNAIAAVIDEKAIYHAAYDQRLFLNLVGIYPHLLRTGTAVHWYLLDELEKLEPYKCVIFTPTVTRFSASQQKFLDSRLKKNNRTLVFLYSTGIYDVDGRFDPANVGCLTGMPVKNQKFYCKRALRRTAISDPVLEKLPSHYTFGFAEPTDYYLYPVPKPEDKILFTMDGSRLPGMVKRDCGDWKMIYCSSPGLSSPVIRGIARDSGIRIFNPHQGDVTYCADGLYAVYSLNGGKRQFHFSPKVTCVREMFGGRIYAVRNGLLDFDLKKDSTVLFHVEKP